MFQLLRRARFLVSLAGRRSSVPNLAARLETPKILAFRERVRAFLRDKLPSDIRAQVAQERMDLDKEDQRRWHKILRANGYACGGWPREHGGPEFTDEQLYVLERETALADAPRPMIYGVSMLGPTLIRHGSDEQKARFLPGILEGDAFWCQGFSETNAGSDLAALQCRAERRGERYVLNGHKMWTSEAHIADWMFGLFRTDSTGRKQQGITFLLVDMKSPGVTIKPIWTFDGTGLEVNQVFLDDVEVPIDQRVGAEGDGWRIGKDLLTFERFGNAEVSRSWASLGRVKDLARRTLRNGRPAAEDHVFAMRLAELEIELRAVDRTELKLLFAGGEGIGAEAAMLKLRGTEIQNRVLEILADLLGPDVAHSGGGGMAPADVPPEAAFALAAHFNYRKTMIYGGSNEIQRSILAKSVLGMA